MNARAAGLVGCRSCGLPNPITQHDCARCEARLHSRQLGSLQRVWAFLLVGMLTYVPANVLPIMTTNSLTSDSSDTILSGVLTLIDMGSWFVAGVVFVASICIPVSKFLIIAWVALSLRGWWPVSTHSLHRMHAITEFIGRWSMIDVFVVAVLAALIQLGAIVTITPGNGINAFAASVIFTMLAANSFDSRMIWDLDGH